MQFIAILAMLGLAVAVPAPQASASASDLQAQFEAFLQSLSASGTANGNTLVLPSSISFSPVIGGSKE